MYVQPLRDAIFLYNVSSFKYILFLCKASLFTSAYRFSFWKGYFRRILLRSKFYRNYCSLHGHISIYMFVMLDVSNMWTDYSIAAWQE